MAAFDHFGDMYDVALKPRLLDSLTRAHIPLKDRPSSSRPSQLSKVISLIKTHSLLSESFTESMDPKIVKAWKSAVTSWISRILSLTPLSSIMPDKCWVGVSLLGVTSEECSSERFLESYTVWFQELLNCLQSPADSSLVRVAACTSMSDLLSRLSRFPQMKRDGSSCALKVVQPVLRMLHDDKSEAIWEAAVHVLCTMITSFPFSIQRHYDSVESAIAVKLFSRGCSLDMLKKLVHCLALLPKSKGDVGSWFLMMQKILILINDQLNLALQGLEEETIRNEFVRLLVLPGEQPPPPLGGYISSEEANNRATKRSEQSLTSDVSILISGCGMLVANTHPLKVNVPVCLLVTLVERILMVNGSLPEMSMPFMTAKQQENICSELPVLHLCSLELLTATIKAAGSQVLPFAGSITRIITTYFKTCALPELRIKVYSAAKSLLISRGVGMALCFAQEVVNNAIADLSTTEKTNRNTLNGSNSDISTGAPLPTNRRKRKHGNTTGSLLESNEGGGLGVEVSKNRPVSPISLRVAAVEALEAITILTGSMRSVQWRPTVDSLLIVTVRNSFKEGPAREEISMFRQKSPAATVTDLQFAGLRALLTSFLSARSRSPYLSQGLELFEKGKQQTGSTKLDELCDYALLTLEVLVHPRALPSLDYVCENNTFGEAQHNFRDEYVSRNKSVPFGSPESVPVDYAKWLEIDDEAAVSLSENTNDTKEPSETRRDNDPEVLPVSLPSETATYADVEMRNVENEVVFKSDQSRVPDGDASTEIEPARIVLDSTIPHNEGSHMESSQGSLIGKGAELASQSNSSLQGASDSNMVHEFEFKQNNGNSAVDEEDPFPDIIDADPDSDSDSD